MSELQSELEEAIATVTANPKKVNVWDRLEELASELDDPESVAAAYKTCLQKKLRAKRAVEIGRRAVHFHREWFGDDPDGLRTLLTRVLELDPKSEWAFGELTVTLTVAERWDELVELYQDVITGTTNKSRLIQLLNEAYQVAKDLANKPDRAIDFLKAKLELQPSEKQQVTLERLLERHERWTDLIAMWRDSLSAQDDKERAQTLGQIAATQFDKLADGTAALESLRESFSNKVHSEDSLALLERVATSEPSEESLRESTLVTIREVYESMERPEDIVRVLTEVLPLCDDNRRKSLHAELGERLAGLDEHSAALDHYASLLILDPASHATQGALRREAQLTDRMDRLASALAAAADSASEPGRRVALLTEAATTLLSLGDGESGAIDLFLAAMATQGIETADVLGIGKRLNLLLDRAGRQSERLGILEQLAEVETADSARRALIGDMAILAEDLGEVDRALAAWSMRIDLDSDDLRALEHLVELLESEKRWPELIAVLEARREQTLPANQKRCDLIHVAKIYEQELGQDEQALHSWSLVKSEYGEDAETVAALSRLMTKLEHWADLTTLLEASNATQVTYLADQFASLGNSYQQSLGDNTKAIECYRRALTVDVGHEGARKGLKVLLDVPELRNDVAEALVHSMRSSGDLIALLDLVEARIAGSEDERKHAEILREAADIAENKAKDLPQALGFVTRLFPLMARDRTLEDRMLRLARGCENWDDTLDAFAKAQKAIADDAFALAAMRFRSARVREEETDDRDGALQGVLQVIAAQPDNHDAVAAAIRLAGPTGRFSDMVTAVLGYAGARQTIPEDLLASVQEFAADSDGDHGYEQLCSVLGDTLEQSTLSATLKAELHWRIAGWYEADVGNDDEARLALLRSTKLDPSRVDTHRKLAGLQGETRDAALYKTVRRLCEIDPGQLSHFRKAAEVALEALGNQEQQESLTALQARAVGAWRGSAPAESDVPADEVVQWAIEQLVTHYVEHDQAKRALDLLIDASRLPFDTTTCLEMRKRAAALASDVLQEPASAIDMYRAVLAQAPGDATALDALATLYEQQGRLPELLGLRRQGLEFESDPERSLALRLEISTLIDEIDHKGGRLELLHKNLKESPGHRASVVALTILLGEQGKFVELCSFLGEQATTLKHKNEVPRAAQLWSQVAQIAETELEDTERALEGYRRVVDLAPNLQALDSLARLYMDRSQSAAAVPWLEQAIDLAADENKPALVKRLAGAHLAAENPEAAVACLHQATSTSDSSLFELRTMLAGLHRDAAQKDPSRWQQLADTLTASLPHFGDDAVARAAREAADIYHDKLGDPAAAIPALTRALETVPQDQGLRLMMARSQRAAGDLETARTLLDSLISEFGRRRSKERAAIHVELAQVARAEADLDAAMNELQLASKMDVGNTKLLGAVADLAREQGDFDQADRSLRALLLIVRRQPPGDNEEAVGISEILFELYHIAAVRDDEEKSEELLESVTETAAASDAETRRLRRTLLEHNEYALLADVLRTRIDLSEEVASKATLLGFLAELQEGPGDDPQAALDARLQSIVLVPDNAELHDKAKALAASQSQLPAYLESLEAMIAQQRRAEEGELTAALLMRAGTIAEEELDDLTKAREHYAAAEDCDTNPADALFALARVCAAQGDIEEQTRALDKLTSLAVFDGSPTAQADALYRLAQLQVAQPDLWERGVELLMKAVEIEARYEEAALTLQVAAETSDNEPSVLAHYEVAARQSGDKTILLDYLERLATSDEAGVSQIREAVTLATELGASERAIVLLERAVLTARMSDDGLSSASWATRDLVHHYTETSRVSKGKELLFEVAPFTEQSQVMSLGLMIAEKSRANNDVDMTIDILDFLRERDPNTRTVWEPLLSIYLETGAGEKISALVDSTLPSLVDPTERTQLRLHKANYLVSSDNDADAIEVLRDACLDDPDSIEVSQLLEQVLRKEGNEEALSDFLWQQFNDAKERGNPDTVTDIAIRLGALLDQISGDSMVVYRQALEVAPESPELLRGVLEKLGDDADYAEQADLIERLLRVEKPEQAADLALSLVELREVLDDGPGVQRALELGQSACPTHTGIRERLESWYQESAQWEPLAKMKIHQAGATEDKTEQVILLRAAAAIYRDSLSDLGTCAGILTRAIELSPDNEGLVSELAATQAAMGNPEEAIQIISDGLEHIHDSAALPLLLLRSDLFRNIKKNTESIVDLERAIELNRDQVEPMLVQALEDTRRDANAEGDIEVERSTTMRLIELCDARDDQESARALLLAWITQDAQDQGALLRLRDMDQAKERWDGVVTACTHLVALQSGEEQIQSALMLAHAAEQIGANEHGLAGLERAHQDQPENAEVRERLRGFYKATEAHRELADLLLVDAGHCDDDDERYEILRSAASIYVNDLGDAESAIGPAQRAKELRPDDHGTVILLADVLVASEQFEEAIAMLEPAIAAHKRRSPELAALQYRMSKVGGAREDQEHQLLWLKKAFDVDRKNGLIASELAHLATEVGDYDLALKPLRAITLMDDPEPVSRVMALLWEAKIEHARGNRAKAELWAKKALREDPAYEEAQEFLAQLSE